MKPTEIILHTKENTLTPDKLVSGTNGNLDFSHYLIRSDGTIEKGRNDNLDICLTLDTNLGITQEQREAIFNLVGKLMIKYNIRADEIHCQSFNFIEEYFKWMRDEVE